MRLLFVIRGKLGDTLIAYGVLRAYVERHPQDEITLLVRANYVPLLARESGLRLIGFPSRVGMIARLLWLRVSRPPFDALAILWGFGAPIAWIARMTRMARSGRKIYLNAEMAQFYPEYPAAEPDRYQMDTAWRVLRCLDPGLARPARLFIPGLAARRRMPGIAVGLVPFADEARRNLDEPSIAAAVREIARRHPADPIWILVNPGEAARAAAPPRGAEFVAFADLDELIRRTSQLKAWYGTDTGPYHLAAAMGVPATVFFGPTQPIKCSFPEQPDLVRVRLAALGNEHCDQKQCARPSCLYQAVANFSGIARGTPADDAPAGCLLSAHSAQALLKNS